jgi:hypothetical protein
MTGVLELMSESETLSTFRQHTRLAIGTLVAEGASKRANVQVDDLNGWGKAIGNAFSAVFKEVWSVVIITGESESSCSVEWCCEVHLGRLHYSIKGSKYANSDSTSVWRIQFNDLFIREFGCQQQVPECEPVRDLVKEKFRDKIGQSIDVVVVRGGRTGGDVIWKLFFHCATAFGSSRHKRPLQTEL